MRFYASGTPRLDKLQPLENSLAKHRLFSLHGGYEAAVLKWFTHPEVGVLANKEKPRPRTLMGDSGGFTAWKSGHPTTVDQVLRAYSRFLDKAKGLFEEVWLINLDTIPGAFGRDPTEEEITDAIKQSDINFEILTKEFGNIILPVFHQGETIDRGLEVEAMTSGKSNYICVSPRNDLPEGQRRVWAQQVHAKLKPQTKTHGLATTGNTMMASVPWHSVDSASWVLACAMGSIIHYWDIGTKKHCATIAISTEGGRDRFQNQHFSTFAKPYQDAIVERAAKINFTPDDLVTNMRARALYSLMNYEMYVTKINEELSEKKAKPVQETLFGV